MYVPGVVREGFSTDDITSNGVVSRILCQVIHLYLQVENHCLLLYTLEICLVYVPAVVMKQVSSG